MRKVKVLAKVFGVAVLFVIVALPLGGLLSQVNASDSFEYQTLSEHKGTYSKGEWATILNATDKGAKLDGSQWQVLPTPGSVAGKKEILSPSEVNKIAVAADGITIWAVDTPAKAVRKSSFNGWTWSDTPNTVLHSAMTAASIPEDNQFIWDIAVATDDANFLAVVTGSASSPDPTEVWVSYTSGTQWHCTAFSAISGGAIVGAIDISMDYGGKYDIAVGVRDGVPGAFSIWVVKSVGFDPWKLQTMAPTANADIVALKFSPKYSFDAALAVVYCTDDATYYNIALRDLDTNDTVAWVYPFPGIEVKNPASPPGASPEAATIVTADLELPSDFMAKDANLRRAYVSTDDAGAGSDAGIFRIDDTIVCQLTYTTPGPIAARRISSIAYFGTCASGKLLAGEVLGYPCTATVPTWFTDSPTECPIPCWFPSLKPATGAAAQGTCAPGPYGGFGNAQVAWPPDGRGRVAYCGTGSADFRNGGVNTSSGSGCWPAALRNSIGLDESAFSLTRNNGETWNQLGLIDTKIDKLTDVAPSADSSTLYLASTNLADASANCAGFDSVWRSSTNPAIVTPLPLQSVGTVWERVLCRPTSVNCTKTQTNHAILRLAPDKEDGDFVFWAAQGTQAQAWSPDYGDYWANITARWPIQDFVLESSMVLYNLSPIGLIQKMPYTGTAWATTLPNVDTGLGSAYSITALAGGHVLVGGGISSMFPVAYSNSGAQSFTQIIQPLAVSNIIVAFDAHFTSNGIIYAVTHKTSGGSIYCNTVPKYTKWTDLKPRGLGYYGIAIDDQGVLYVANPSFVEYMRGPIQSKSKKTNWDALTTGLPGWIRLTLSPNSLKLSNEPKNRTRLYAIDNNGYNPITNIGMLWTWREIK